MKQFALRGLLVPAFALALALPASAGELKLTMDAGRVTLIAQDVPVRQILDEWARVGHTKIVNAEKVIGPPVTLQLVNVPEKDALDVVLRTAAGYMAAPRPEQMANASQYDRIMIMATSRAPMALPANAQAAPPAFQRPPMPTPVDDDDDEPVNVNVPVPQGQPGPTPNGPVVAPFPGAQPPNGEQNQPGPMLSSKPGVPVGVPQNPQATGQPNPYQPTVVKPVGPGGGGPGGA